VNQTAKSLHLASENDLTLALELADLADSVSIPRFRALDLIVEQKPDLTPVSDADKSVESTLRELLRNRMPQDAIIGEEFSQSGSADRTWIIDPIDGTKNFVRGVPVWATLIALRDPDGIGVGVVSAPALNRRWWALRGHGAWLSEGGRPVRAHVSRVGRLADASFAYSDSIGWDIEKLSSLLSSTWRQRAYGDFWSHCLVAEGAVDFAAEPELALYDYAALVPIVTEAGGIITDFAGQQLPVQDSSAHPAVLTTNGNLHKTLKDLLIR
jgi:histidinol-phosphatase